MGNSTKALDNNWDLEIELIVKEGRVYYPSAIETNDPAPVNVGDDDYDFKVEFTKSQETIWFSADKARMKNKAAVFYFVK